MQAMQAVKEAAKSAGIPITHIGPALGKKANYISAYSTNGRTPSCSIAAAMLEPSGYVLAAIPRADVPETALIIDPVAPDAESE